MKALIFNNTIDYNVEVGDVILVPDNTPIMHHLQELHAHFVQKKITKELLPTLGEKAKLKNGKFSNLYFRSLDKFLVDKKYDFQNWIIKNYKGKRIKFEANF